mmetsp:Transcript_95500/g.270377  ORF Transcript_95500/g.270377 Transcript_95500/m.270377 type:complete len:342 (+) Transcript_95500:69-1094(+)
MNRGLLPGGLSSDAYFDKHLRPLDAEHYSAAGIVPYRRKQGDLELLLPLEKPWNSFTKGYDPIGWNVFCGKRVPRQERSAETTAVRCFLECVGHVDGCPDTEKLYGMTQGSHVLWYPSGKFALLLVEVPDEVMASFPEQFSQAFNQAGPNEEYRILPMGIKKYVKQIEALEWVPTSNLIPETKGEVSDLLNNILRVNGFRDFLCGQFVAPDSNEPMVDCAPPAENAPKYANEYGGKPEGKGKGGKGGGWGGKGGKGRSDGKIAKIPDDLKDRRFHGFMKHMDKKSGFGFIECDETRRAFDRDIFVDMTRLPPGVERPGHPVTFVLVVGRRGFPEASAVKRP